MKHLLIPEIDNITRMLYSGLIKIQYVRKLNLIRNKRMSGKGKDQGCCGLLRSHKHQKRQEAYKPLAKNKAQPDNVNVINITLAAILLVW